MHYAIDRIEGAQAVLEDDSGTLFQVSVALLPNDAKPGDVLTVCDGFYCHDREETVSRRTRIYRLEQMLRNGNAERK